MGTLSQLRRRDASPGVVLAIVSAAVVMASLDLFIVNVALPDLTRDLDSDLGALSWVLNGYAIVYAALLVLFGRMAERRSRESGFLLGVLIFTLASALCGAATSVEMLVAARILQAAGAALLTPTSLGLVLATAPPEKRQSSVRAWTAVGGVAAALGPVAGGLLVEASWRWVFLVNVPVGLAALYVGWRRLPNVPGHPVPLPDALGAGLLTAGVAGLTLALVQGGDWGWGSTATVGILAASLALLAAFALHCARARNPLVEPALFRAAGFTGASVVMTLFSVAFGAMLLSIVLWGQDVWGWSALETGLAVAPGPLMVPLFSFLVAGRLIARFGPGPVAALGCTSLAAGLAWWAAAASAAPDYVGTVLGGMLLTGVGVGLTLPTLMATAAGSLPPQSFATGSAVVNMLRQVGLALGVALFVAIVGTPGSAEEARDVFATGWTVLAAVSAAGAVAAAVLLRPRRPAPVPVTSREAAAAADA
ncbi:MAG TPA: MFS transporter [Solirubrobacteraceae bacterium]|nr:MFS transporter [Solirubrobacteraceae bacterium]